MVLISTLNKFASSETQPSSIFDALGIDWKTLILQIVAFLILVWLLKKLVYPWLLKSIDERQAGIEEASRLAEQARQSAEATKQEVEQLLSKARKDADEIVATAKTESADVLSASEAKSKKQAEQILASAQSAIEKEVIAAKKALHNETLELVALATEKIVRQKITTALDKSLIETAIKESK